MDAEAEQLEALYRSINRMGVEAGQVMEVLAEAAPLVSASRLRWPEEKKHQERLQELERRFREKREVTCARHTCAGARVMCSESPTRVCGARAALGASCRGRGH